MVGATALAESERLVIHQLGDGEGVMDLRHVDVIGRDPCHLVGFVGAARRQLGPGHVPIAVGVEAGRDLRGGDADCIGPRLARDVAARDHQRGRAVAGRAAVPERERVGDRPRAHHLLDRDALADLRIRIERAVIVRLHRNFGELPLGQPVFVHVAAGAHRVERRHHHALIDLPILGFERQRAATELGELLNPDDQHHVVPAAADRRPGFGQGRRTRGAGVLHVDDRHAGEPEGLHDPLARHHSAERGAAIDGVDRPRRDTGLDDGFLDGRPADLRQGLVGIFGERDQAGADDADVAHD